MIADQSKDLAYEGFVDPVFFLRYFLEHLFPKEIPWFHQGIVAILTRRSDFLHHYGHFRQIQDKFVNRDGTSIFADDGTLNLRRYTEIVLPRGFSKTTLAGVGIGIWNTLYEEIPFSVYVSNAAPHAKMQLTNIKRELTDNERILAVFGSRRPDRQSDEKWTEEFFETTTGCAMAARGRGGQLRGLNHRGARPKLIVVDDLEDMESVSTDEQREKTRRWAYGDLIPALPELDPEATIVALGTILHPDSLLNTWANDPAWTTIKFSAKDKASGELLWPELMDDEKLEMRRLSFASAGESHVFYMEYFNECVDPETQPFKREYLKIEAPPEINTLTVAIYCDPAIAEKAKSDRSVVAAVGMNEKGRLWVLDMWVKRGASEREKVDTFFAFSKKYSARFHGIESNAYQAALIHLAKEEMFRKGQYFEIEAVHHKSKKIIRIQAILQPRYAAGYISHARHFPELEAEMFDFPNGAHDDTIDAVAGAVALLDPVAAFAAGDKDLTHDEYEPDDGSWRLYA